MKFYNDYTISEKGNEESTISYITKKEGEQIPIESGIYNYGLISILDVDISVNIMKSWDWRFQRFFIPIVSTAFGDLFLCSARSGKCYFFQTQYDSLELITDNVDELLNSALIDDGIKAHVLFEDKFNKVCSMHGRLKYAETYILKPWISLGGKDIVENYSIGDLNVYLDLVSQAKDPDK